MKIAHVPDVGFVESRSMNSGDIDVMNVAFSFDPIGLSQAILIISHGVLEGCVCLIAKAVGQ